MLCQQRRRPQASRPLLNTDGCRSDSRIRECRSGRQWWRMLTGPEPHQMCDADPHREGGPWDHITHPQHAGRTRACHLTPINYSWANGSPGSGNNRKESSACASAIVLNSRSCDERRGGHRRSGCAFDRGPAFPPASRWRGAAVRCGRGFARAGQVTEGLTATEQAMEQAERTGARWLFPESLRIRGELLLLQAEAGAPVSAEDHFVKRLTGHNGKVRCPGNCAPLSCCRQ